MKKINVMKQVTIILLTIVTVFSFSSCEKVTGEGPIETENRSVSNFSKVSSSISGKIYFTIEPQYKVQVMAQSNILDVLETYKQGNELIIKFKNGVRVKNHDEIIINISAPTIEGLRLSGSGNIEALGNIVTSNLELGISGSGSMMVQNAQVTNTLYSSISGSGSIRVVSGTAKNGDISISGSGDVDMSSLTTQKVNTRVSGSGSAKVNVSDNLDVSISGSGDVYYFGNPVISSHISGSGKVLPL